jgi:hypothetical protein
VRNFNCIKGDGREGCYALHLDFQPHCEKSIIPPIDLGDVLSLPCTTAQLTLHGRLSDSLPNGHYLVFKTDSTLEFAALLGHLSPRFILTLRYKRNGNEIKLLDNTFSQKDSHGNYHRYN